MSLGNSEMKRRRAARHNFELDHSEALKIHKSKYPELFVPVSKKPKSISLATMLALQEANIYE